MFKRISRTLRRAAASGFCIEGFRLAGQRPHTWDTVTPKTLIMGRLLRRFNHQKDARLDLGRCGI